MQRLKRCASGCYCECVLSERSFLQALVFKNLLDTRLRVMLHYKPDDSYLANVTNVNYEPVNDIDIGKYIAAAFGKVRATLLLVVHVSYVSVIGGAGLTADLLRE